MDQESKDEFLMQLQANKLIIYKICNAYCRNAGDRDDLAQEITYQLWKSYQHFNGSVKFSTWMYRVALNVAITLYRKTKSAETIVEIGEREMEIEDSESHITELESNITLLQQFINQLKPLDKALTILYLEEKSHRETAEILGITETNVATRIGRIKDKLKQKFSTINHQDHG